MTANNRDAGGSVRNLTDAEAATSLFGMRSIIVIILMICLQAAMAPLCLCHGLSDIESQSSCCHSPAEDQQQPCPHCDAVKELALVSPSKSLAAPETQLCEIPAVVVSDETVSLFGNRFDFIRLGLCLELNAPPALNRCALLGVFLI